MSAQTIGKIILAIGVIYGLIGHALQHRRIDLVAFMVDTWANVMLESIGIALVVLLIDQLNQKRTYEEQKARWIRQLASSDKLVTQEAAREIDAHGWQKDGSLCRRDFFGANWEGIYLPDADLRWSTLTAVNMQNANIPRGKFQGTLMNDANLVGVKSALGWELDSDTTLPDASKWKPTIDIGKFIDPHHKAFWRSPYEDLPASQPIPVWKEQRRPK